MSSYSLPNRATARYAEDAGAALVNSFTLASTANYMHDTWTKPTTLTLPNGQRALFRYRGNGPIVLYVHGWAHSSTVWERLETSLETPYTHVALELPGFGVAGEFPLKDTSISGYARFMRHAAHALTQHFNSPIHAIVAHSLGALAVARACSAGAINSPPHLLILFGIPLDGVPLLQALLPFYPLLLVFLYVLRIVPFQMSSPILRVVTLATTCKWSLIDDRFLLDTLVPEPSILLRTLFAVAFASGKADFGTCSACRVVVARGQWDWIMTRRVLSRAKFLFSAEVKEFLGTTHTPHIEKSAEFDRWLCFLLNSTLALDEIPTHECRQQQLERHRSL